MHGIHFFHQWLNGTIEEREKERRRQKKNTQKGNQHTSTSLSLSYTIFMEESTVQETKTDRYFIKLTEEELDLSECVDFVKSPQCGAISTFLGTTRDHFEGKQVETLEYEAYIGMALETIRSICDEVCPFLSLFPVFYPDLGLAFYFLPPSLPRRRPTGLSTR